MKQFWLLLLLLVALPLATHAQITPITTEQCGLLGISCVSTLGQYIVAIVNVLLSFVALVAVIVIIYAGVKYITAAGDEQAAGEAKKIILYAVIGLIVIGLSAAIVNFVVLAIQGNVIL